MQIHENYDLTLLNTFGIKAQAKFFTEITDEIDLEELFTSNELKVQNKLFLGGGSNVLFTKDFEGIVILNKLKGVEILKEDRESAIIKSMGGETWHDLVLFAVSRGYWGIENLSLIPGTVGAAPMQNIGAYGSELKDVLESVVAFEISTGKKKFFENSECKFGYRDSIFKNELKGRYFIVSVTLKLSKILKPNISYRILKEYLEKNKIELTNPQNISEAVSAIRRSKLPDPKDIGNAGSFFKNVILLEEEAKEFLSIHKDTPFFREDEFIKIPAGWLIEQCGLKGYKVGNVGVHPSQALVLVNYGGATGAEIKNLAQHIIDSVLSKFGLKLTPEVNFV